MLQTLIRRYRKRGLDLYKPVRIQKRWGCFSHLVNLRPTDMVLDMGCGRGIATLEAATAVAHIHGVDLSPRKIRLARNEAKRRGLKNATFEQGSIFDYRPREHDVSLLLSVLGKTDDAGKKIGLDEVGALLRSTKRLLVMRCGLDKPGSHTRQEIDNFLASQGFACPTVFKIPEKKANGKSPNHIVIGERMQ